jgi:hypothetical protein
VHHLGSFRGGHHGDASVVVENVLKVDIDTTVTRNSGTTIGGTSVLSSDKTSGDSEGTHKKQDTHTFFSASLLGVGADA